MSRTKRLLHLSQFLSYFPVIKSFDYLCACGISLYIYIAMCVRLRRYIGYKKKKKKKKKNNNNNVCSLFFLVSGLLSFIY